MACAGFAEPVTLRFTVWDGDESVKVIRRVVRQFENEHPNIKVRLEPIPDYSLYHQKMLTQYAADAAPDVAMMDPGHFQALAKRRALIPLNTFFDKTPGFDIKAYYKEIVAAHSIKDTVYVLPRDIAPEGLIYYNKKMFDEAGIPYPDGTWTWDFKVRPELREKDFIWVMRELTKKAGEKTVRYGYVPAWPGLLTDMFVYSRGLKYVDDQDNPRKVSTNTPELNQVFDFVVELMRKDKWVPDQNDLSSVLQSTSQQLFAKQKTAMFQSGIWEVPNMRRELKPGSKEFFDWDIALAPGYANGRKACPAGGSGYAIFSSTAHPNEAWELTRYMAGPVGMKAMAEAGIAQPAIRELALSDCWLPGPNTPLEQQWPKNRKATDEAVPFVVWSPSVDYWPEVQLAIDGRTGSVYDGTRTVADALSTAQNEGQARLDALVREENMPLFPWSAGLVFGLVVVAAIGFCLYWPERKIKYSNAQKRESRAAYGFISPWIIGLLVFSLGPMILSLIMAFLNWDMILPARWRGLGNFHEAFVEDSRFWVSLKVTFLYTLISTPIGLVISLATALLLSQKVRGVPLFRALYYLPSLASGVAASLVWRRVLSPDDGVLNQILYSPWLEKFTHLGSTLSQLAGKPNEHVNWLGNDKTALVALILMSLWGVGGTVIVLLAGLQGIPTFYGEAATVDGANAWQKFKVITLPLLTPALFFSLVTTLIGSFQVFTQVFVITNGSGGPNDSTLVYMLVLYNAAFRSLRLGYASALAWVLFVIILIATLLQFRLSKWVHYESETR